VNEKLEAEIPLSVTVPSILKVLFMDVGLRVATIARGEGREVGLGDGSGEG